jgi:hypothetical protein
MKPSDIINQLRAVLPKYTNKFSGEEFSIISLTSTGTTATANATNHGLTTNDYVSIKGAKIPIVVESLTRYQDIAICILAEPLNPEKFEITGANESEYNGLKSKILDLPCILINIVSLTKSGDIVTATTKYNHGLVVNSNLKVNIFGAQQTVYNKEDVLISSVPAPNQFTYISKGETVSPATSIKGIYCIPSFSNNIVYFEVQEEPTTPATGTIYCLEIKRDGYNGFKKVTVLDSDNFTYELEYPLNSPAQGTITADYSIRIDGAVSLDRAVEMYSEHNYDEFWLFLVMNDIFVSKERKEPSDLTYVADKSTEYLQRLAYNFDLFVFIPTSQSLGAIDLLDEIPDLRKALFKSLLRTFFNSEFSEGTNDGVVFIGDSIADYNKAIYIHRFSFMASGIITKDDTVEDGDSVPLRRVTETIVDKEKTSTGVIADILYD